jgi:adenosylcobinamide-GDP ribazoletransferase
MANLLRALSLLTILPVRVDWNDAGPPGRVMAAYALAGSLLGLPLAALAAVLVWSGAAARAQLLSASLLLAAWAGLTGALHLDGWADCCDGLFVPAERERRLEIMKDPRLGSFGGAGLVLLLLIKLGAIAGLVPAALPTGWRLWSWLLLWLAVPTLARCAVVMAAYHYPSARPDGMAAHFRRGLEPREAALAGISALPLVAALGIPGIALAAATILALLGLGRLASNRLGGLTGDVYGAIIELSETAMLVVACFWSV